MVCTSDKHEAIFPSFGMLQYEAGFIGASVCAAESRKRQIKLKSAVSDSDAAMDSTTIRQQSGYCRQCLLRKGPQLQLFAGFPPSLSSEWGTNPSETAVCGSSSGRKRHHLASCERPLP